jgi:dTDP-4-amino-4,6-dideoxygalactose transaminase
MPILLAPVVDRLRFMEQMKLHGIQTSIHYPPIHTFSAYASEKDHGCSPLPITEDIAMREVTLPLYPGMTDDDVMIVSEAISKSLQ